MPKVYLSPSTQEYNLTVVGLSEEYFANLVVDSMLPYLNASGIEYGRNSPQMTALQAALQANEGNYDFYLAIHTNAAAENIKGQASGAEIYYYPESVPGLRAATIFADNYKKIYPQPENVKIIPLETLIELNKTKMPAILFELAYHDNIADFSWFAANIPEIGKNLAMSVAEYFSVPFVEPRAYALGIVNTQGGNLNVRAQNSPNSQIIGSLRNGETVGIIERIDNKYKIIKDGFEGFVDSKYIDVL